MSSLWLGGHVSLDASGAWVAPLFELEWSPEALHPPHPPAKPVPHCGSLGLFVTHGDQTAWP